MCRSQLVELDDSLLLARLDEAAEDVGGLRASLADRVVESSLKLMTDSMASSSRGRKQRKKS